MTRDYGLRRKHISHYTYNYRFEGLDPRSRLKKAKGGNPENPYFRWRNSI